MTREERYKGHDILLEIWADVVERVPFARLVVAGDGDDRGRLTDKAIRLGLHGQVQFVGAVSDSVLGRLYRDCAFFVMPSAGEGFGLVFTEAMRAGKPCIAGSGAPEEVVEHEVTGLVVDPGDRRSLVASVVRLFEDAETRARMGRAARLRFAERFCAERFRERLLEALELGEVPVCVG